MKFIRRAVEDDKNLLVVTLQRTADNKYHALRRRRRRRSWPAGFPKTREELFAYRGLILGQHRGGRVHRRSAADDRRVRRAPRRRPADARRLAVVRRRRLRGHAGRRRAAGRPRARGAVARRSAGRAAQGATRPAPARRTRSRRLPRTEAASSARWNELPVLTSVNPLRTLKPGATVLLTGTDEKRRDAAGAGVPALRPRQGARVAGPGLVALADAREHAARGHDARELWRQLLRWLVDGVPEPVDVAHQHRARRGRRAGHADRGGRRQVVRRAERRARGREGEGPAGQHRRRADAVDRRAERRVPRHVHRRERGHVYGGRRSVARGQAARHRRDARARGAGRRRVLRRQMHAARLKRIADETGGRFYTPDTVTRCRKT